MIVKSHALTEQEFPYYEYCKFWLIFDLQITNLMYFLVLTVCAPVWEEVRFTTENFNGVLLQ